MKKMTEPILPMLGKYVVCFIVAGMFLAVAAGIEAYLSPLLMKAVLDSVY